jgi:LysR family transcriptional activator of mexEF-oprN operon
MQWAGLADHLATPHLPVSFDGRRGVVDDVPESTGRRRTVVTSTPHLAGVAA